MKCDKCIETWIVARISDGTLNNEVVHWYVKEPHPNVTAETCVAGGGFIKNMQE